MPPSTDSPPSIAILCTHPTLRARAEKLATELSLPLINKQAADFILALTPERLELRDQRETIKHTPIYADLCSAKLQHRRQYGGGRQQAIAKAVGLHKTPNLTVIDATAGLGQDSLILASLGCQITMLERSPIIAALLDDALQRAALNTATADIAARMQLIHQDASHYLAQLPPKQWPDVIYLDPMYPERKKSALANKEMRTLRDIVGDDTDTEALLQNALNHAHRRVVIKRPRLAPPHIPKPSHQLEGKSTRYDIYVIHNTTQETIE